MGQGTKGTEDAVAFRKFVVWVKAHELAMEMYRFSVGFREKDLAWLASQLRRAAYSVPANFVEGYARGSTKEFLRYLNIASASLSELEYGLEFTKGINAISQPDYEHLQILRSEVGYLLHKFKESVKRNNPT